MVWGSTWLAIKFQLGVVSPEVSLVYRFALAAALIALHVQGHRALARGFRCARTCSSSRRARCSASNYIFVYRAELHVASGLVAVLFSTMVFMSLVGTRLVFGTPIGARALVGATLGVAASCCCSCRRSSRRATAAMPRAGIAFGLGRALIATGGNLVSMQMQRRGLPIFESTAWGMAYGAATPRSSRRWCGAAWTFDARLPYVLSLAYLAVFGSVVAFGAYLTLLKQVGAGPSSYTSVATPVVAMLLSTLFEGYQWSALALLGVLLAAAGNVLVLRQRGSR